MPLQSIHLILSQQELSNLADKIVLRALKKENGCIEWSGSKNDKGYGEIRGSNRMKKRYVHRLAFELFVHPLVDDVQVLHECDNPPCLNPAHLFLGSNLDNVLDKISKGRQPRGENHGQSKLSDEQVIQARLMREKGMSYKKIADKLGVWPMTIWNIVKRIHWAHI